MLRHRRRRVIRTAVAGALVGVLGLTGCSGDSGPKPLPLPQPSSIITPSPTHPNIVFVLTDDLSWNLVKYMPAVRDLEKRGMTFTNYTVTDSLCCPSRASIFTGKFPHNTHILGNQLPSGGYEKFRHLGEERSTFATSLLRAGYRTAFMGKYLNRYQPAASNPPIQQERYGAHVPPGWSTWDAVGANGYNGYAYQIADGHRLENYGRRPSDFLNTILQHKATSFVRYAASKTNPFMLEVATFSPHHPYTPAPRDLGTFHGPIPKTAAFNKLGSPAPAWMLSHRPLGPRMLRRLQTWWELRVEDVQSVSRMITQLERTVEQVGQGQNTVFVFSSDNGYHMGEHTLAAGKQTAFDTDIRVPLVVAGPGIPADTTNTDMTENVDLRPTFEQLAGAPTPADVNGRSIVPLLHGEPMPWRTYALVEHDHPAPSSKDPDAQGYLGGDPPTYTAIRTKTFIYVRYQSGDREYYDLVKDPNEMRDIGPALPPWRIAQLDRIMDALVACRGGDQCWQAGVPGST